MIDFSARDAMQLKDIPVHHKDPFDRMLIAQSLARGMPTKEHFSTADRYHIAVLLVIGVASCGLFSCCF